jgi:hypothetical protein
LWKASAAKVDQKDMESNDIRRFEQLRRELIELERRVQKTANGSKKEEVCLFNICFYIANEKAVGI